MSRRLSLAAALLVTALMFVACTTESDDGGGNNEYATLINDWKISAATVTPVAQLPAIPGVPGIPTTANLLLVIDNCDKNATLSFRANGDFIDSEGTGCSADKTGNWTRSDSTLYVTYDDTTEDSDTLTIVELSATVLKLRERNSDLPDDVMRTINWTLVPR